jgi:hypothetical protein
VRSNGDVPVLDHAGEVLSWADADEVARLLADGRNARIGTPRRVRAIRLRGPDPALSTEGSGPRPGLGMVNRRESFTNVRGVWSFERIPDHMKHLFEGVVLERLKAA